MDTIVNLFKSGYYRIVTFIRDLPGLWYATIWAGLLALTFICIINFFKKYDGTQKEFVKVSLIVLAVVLFACLIFITYIR